MFVVREDRFRPLGPVGQFGEAPKGGQVGGVPVEEDLQLADGGLDLPFSDEALGEPAALDEVIGVPIEVRLHCLNDGVRCPLSASDVGAAEEEKCS